MTQSELVNSWRRSSVCSSILCYKQERCWLKETFCSCLGRLASAELKKKIKFEHLKNVKALWENPNFTSKIWLCFNFFWCLKTIFDRLVFSGNLVGLRDCSSSLFTVSHKNQVWRRTSRDFQDKLISIWTIKQTC